MREADFTLTPHMPDDGEIGVENAAERLKDGVCAKLDIVSCEVGTAMAENDGETERGYHASSTAIESA